MSSSPRSNVLTLTTRLGYVPREGPKCGLRNPHVRGCGDGLGFEAFARIEPPGTTPNAPSEAPPTRTAPCLTTGIGTNTRIARIEVRTPRRTMRASMTGWGTTEMKIANVELR